MIGYADDSNGQTNNFYDTVCDARWRTGWRIMLMFGQPCWASRAGRWSCRNARITSSPANLLCRVFQSYVTKRKCLEASSSPMLLRGRNMSYNTYLHMKPTRLLVIIKNRQAFRRHSTKNYWKKGTSWHLSCDPITLREKKLGRFTSQRTFQVSRINKLANSHFTERQLTKIQKKAMSSMFAKCGYNRNTKREVLFGPLELRGGANFRRLHDQQGNGRLCTFLRHWRSQTQVGELLRILLSWCNYAAGLSLLSVLEDTRTALPHLVESNI